MVERSEAAERVAILRRAARYKGSLDRRLARRGHDVRLEVNVDWRARTIEVRLHDAAGLVISYVTLGGGL